MGRRAATRRKLLTALAICGISMLAAPAHAQLIEQYFPSDIPGYAPDLSASVTQRMLMQNQSQGIEVGSFVVRPQISESGGYQDDILGVAHSGSSFINNGASLRINSDWGRNALGASFSVNNKIYPELPVANQTNWAASLGGSLSLGNDSASAAYSHLAQHLNATDLGTAGIVNPVPYTVDDIRLGYTKLLGRFSLVPSFEYSDFNFGKSSGTPAANYNGLNHQTESGGLSGLYEFAPGNNAVAIFRYTKAQFGNASSKDYTDEGGFLGLDFRSDALIQYRLLGGVERRHFSTGANRTITIPTFQINAVWMPTQLDTVTATGYRQLEDPTSPFAHNQTVTTGRLQLDHQLHHNIFLRGFGSVGETSSQSGQAHVADNHQTQWQLGASAFWNINRHMRGSVSYTHNEGNSSGPAEDAAGGGFASFHSNSIILGVTLFE